MFFDPICSDTLRRRAWPRLVGLHDELWEDVRVSSSLANEETKVSTGESIAERVHRRRSSTDQKNDSQSSLDFNDSASLGSVVSAASIRDRVLARSDDFHQIELDVTRCTWHLLTGTQRAIRLQMEHKRHKKVSKLIRRKQRRLANLINVTLVQSYERFSQEDKLRYYQGYHDVACIVLSTLSGSSPARLRPSFQGSFSSLEGMAAATGLDMPAAVLLQLSQSHFRDCMKSNFLQLQTALRLTLFPLLAYFDPVVHDFLIDCEMEPYFALPWVITWFSHEIRDTELVKRLFDVFMVSHPMMPIYMSVAMMTHPVNREEILKTELDFSSVHQVLASLPKNSSMVGWKYQPGDGYVSDDGGDDDELSIGHMDSQSSVDTDFLLSKEALQCALEAEGGTEAVSLVSSAMSSMLDAPVPFQELIDNAIVFMKRVPPGKLMNLAKNYYGKARLRELLDEHHVNVSDINMMRSPPWARTPKAKADWVLKQRARQTRGESSMTRRDRKRVRESGLDALQEESEAESELDEGLVKFLEERSAIAVIAAGFASGDDAERRRKRRRNMMILGAVAVALVAVLVGIALQQRGVEHFEASLDDTSSGEAQSADEMKSAVVSEAAESPVIQMNEGSVESLELSSTANGLIDECPGDVGAPSVPAKLESLSQTSKRVTRTWDAFSFGSIFESLVMKRGRGQGLHHSASKNYVSNGDSQKMSETSLQPIGDPHLRILKDLGDQIRAVSKNLVALPRNIRRAIVNLSRLISSISSIVKESTSDPAIE
jgi:hypothetical protein